MIFLPLPIVVALMLATVLVMLRERLLQAPSGRLFGALLVGYCFGLVVIGLRWGYNFTYLLPVMAIHAALWCPLTWVAFRSLSGNQALWYWPNDWPHVIPAAAVAICILLWPVPIDLILITTYGVYAYMLWRLARRGPDALKLVRLSSARFSHLALSITSILLFFYTFVDVLIALDFGYYAGQHAADIVAWANVPSILILGLAAVVGGQARSEQEDELPAIAEPETDENTEKDAQELMPKLEELLVGQQLYTDPELNLQRLARKCGVPARRVSRTVNLITQQNVSQWVNEQRVKAACDRLRTSEENVTEIMLAVGFITKSNFNREFKRITGTSPSAWRKQAA